MQARQKNTVWRGSTDQTQNNLWIKIMTEQMIAHWIKLHESKLI